ncbi:flotillin family protein [Vibrio phage KIT04]|nr:flotillin family protein [Vibrio phage KIT04]
MNLLIVAAVALVVLAVILLTYLKGYTVCPSDQLLIVNGKQDKSASEDDATGGAQVYQGGSVFVMPFFYEKSWLSLKPISGNLSLNDTLTLNNVKVSVDMQYMYAVDTDDVTTMRAAVRNFMGLDRTEIKNMIDEVAFGSIRSVIATLSIEDLISDREAFNAAIRQDLDVELKKIGIKLLNQNVRNITDKDNYIESLGEKASALVTQNALTATANAVKDGTINQERARTEMSIGQEEQLTAKQVGVAEQQSTAAIEKARIETEKELGVTEQHKNKRVGVAELKAQEAEGIAESTVKEAQANQERETAVAQSDKAIADAQLEANIAKEANKQLVQVEIDKKEAILKAEADAETVKVDAQAKAEAVLVAAEAEAKGLLKVLEAKAEGYKAIVDSCGGNVSAAANLMVIEKMEELTRIQMEALANIEIDKIVVMDGGSGDGGVKGFLNNYMTSLPQMHEMAKGVGIDLPEFLGTQAK